MKPTIDKLQARIKELEKTLAVKQKQASDLQAQKTEAEDRCRRFMLERLEGERHEAALVKEMTNLWLGDQLKPKIDELHAHNKGLEATLAMERRQLAEATATRMQPTMDKACPQISICQDISAMHASSGLTQCPHCGRHETKENLLECNICVMKGCSDCHDDWACHETMPHLSDHFSKTLRKWQLSDEDHEQLMKRGLSEQQIQAIGFKTVSGKHQVPYTKSWKGGVQWIDGGYRFVPTLLIPARNYEGQIVALHHRPHHPDSEKGAGKIGKYMWASANKSFNLPNGETPLFWCPGQGHSLHKIALIEGGLKAYVFAHLSGMNAIGAAGGQFWQSAYELQRTLRAQCVTEVTLFPDAGAVNNVNVLLDYFKTFRMLEEWGIPTLVAWWGQVDKAETLDADDYLLQCPDITVDTIQKLKVPEFWEKVPQECQDKLLAGKNAGYFKHLH